MLIRKSENMNPVIVRASKGNDDLHLSGITENFAKQLIDKGDDDYTKYYVPMAVRNIGNAGPTFHYLKKKEVRAALSLLLFGPIRLLFQRRVKRLGL